MKLKGLKVGQCITGSFCNFNKVNEVINALKDEGVSEIIPIVSESSNNFNTRFYKAEDFKKMLIENCGTDIIDSIVKAEPVGPKNMVDIILVCPCTGNTLAKLASGITDTTVTMAIKSHIRNNKPVVLGVSTNDGLGSSLKNIGEMLNTKNFYFVPFRQDDFAAKPKSLVLDYTYVVDTIEQALKNVQIQPILSRK